MSIPTAQPINIEMVSPELIRPPHAVRRAGKRDRIYGSMGFHGWIGRPILVFKSERKLKRPYIAATGSHRIAAARSRGLSSIPVVVAPWTFERCASCTNADFVPWKSYDDLLDSLRTFEADDARWWLAIALLLAEMYP